MSDADDFFDEVRSGAVQEEDVPRDGHGRYLLPGAQGGDVYGHTRVTTIAGTLDTGFSLGRWNRRTVVRGMGLRPDLMARAGAADPEDTNYGKLLDSIADSAFEAAGGSSGSNLGSAQHKVFERYFLKGEPLENMPEYFHADLRAVEAELQRCQVRIIPEFVERVVRCSIYGRAGKIDGIAEEASGRLAIIDLKTEKDPVEHPEGKTVQLSIYANSDLMMNYNTGAYEAMPSVRTDYALVIWCRPGSGVAKLLRVPIDYGWMGARIAEELRAWRQNKLVIAPYIPGEAWAPAVVTQPAAVVTATQPTADPAQPIYPCGDCGAPDYQQGPHTAQCSQNPANVAAYQASQVLDQQAEIGQPPGLAHVIGGMVDQAMAQGNIGPSAVAKLNQQAAVAVQQKCGTCGYLHTVEQGCPSPEWAAAQTVPNGQIGFAGTAITGAALQGNQPTIPNGHHPSTMAEAGLTGPVSAVPVGRPVVGPGTAYPLPQDQNPAPAVGTVPPGPRPPAPKAAAGKMSPAELFDDLINRPSDGIDPEAFYMEMVAELTALSKKDQLQPVLELLEPGIADKELRCHREPLAQKIVERVKRQRDIRAQQAGGQPSALLSRPEVQADMAAAQQYGQQVTQVASAVQAAPWQQAPPQNGVIDMTYEGVMAAINEATSTERLGVLYTHWVANYGQESWTGTILDAANAKMAQLQLVPTH